MAKQEDMHMNRQPLAPVRLYGPSRLMLSFSKHFWQGWGANWVPHVLSMNTYMRGGSLTVDHFSVSCKCVP